MRMTLTQPLIETINSSIFVNVYCPMHAIICVTLMWCDIGSIEGSKSANQPMHIITCEHFQLESQMLRQQRDNAPKCCNVRAALNLQIQQMFIRLNHGYHIDRQSFFTYMECALKLRKNPTGQLESVPDFFFNPLKSFRPTFRCNSKANVISNICFTPAHQSEQVL